MGRIAGAGVVLAMYNSVESAVMFVIRMLECTIDEDGDPQARFSAKLMQLLFDDLLTLLLQINIAKANDSAIHTS